MGAHTPDAYRYRGGQPAWEYPRPGGNESSSALSARNARRRVPNESLSIFLCMGVRGRG